MSSTVTPEQQAANYRTARRNVETAMGLPQDTPAAQVPLEVMAEYRRRIAEIIVAHPQSFTDESLTQAQLALDHIAGGKQLDTGSFSLMEGVESFTDEVIRQEERINPFSEQNGATTASALIVALVIGVAVFAYFKARGNAAPLPVTA